MIAPYRYVDSRKNGNSATIQRRALRIDQNVDHPLYMFSLTSDELLQVAEISRITRDEAGKLIGYQRADVRQHVQNIVEYLDSDSIIFPNSIILALSSSVKFKQSRGPSTDDGFAKAGTLEIQIPTGDGPKPAWIVDGQQRALALSKCKRRDFAIPVNAFIADEVKLQRDQFLRVNSSKPLPRGLITELLPEVSSKPPTKSRLMHGAGVRAMGRLMDRIMPVINLREKSAKADIIRELKLVAPICRWTKGNWDDMDGMKWNDLNNVPHHDASTKGRGRDRVPNDSRSRIGARREFSAPAFE